QVFRGRTLVELDRVDHLELARPRPVGEREQPDPRGPAFRLLEQQRQDVRLELDAEPVEQLLRFLGRQGEVPRAQPGQLAARPEGAERQRREETGRDGETQKPPPRRPARSDAPARTYPPPPHNTPLPP